MANTNKSKKNARPNKKTTVKKTETSTAKPIVEKVAPKQPAGIVVECSKLKKAALLFAFHESTKAAYLIKMAQGGANINPRAAAQRIDGLRQFHNSRLDSAHELHSAVSITTNKTKKITPEMDKLLFAYYPENTNSKTPEGYSWPGSL